MREKRPKLHVEMDLVQYYDLVREELKKELDNHYSADPEQVVRELFTSDELNKVEAEMQKNLDQVMRMVENKSLTFLKSNPERIPYYIEQLSQCYTQFDEEN